jgi:hypothetical protein
MTNEESDQPNEYGSEHADDAACFALSPRDLEIIGRFARSLRQRLAREDPLSIRNAAVAILMIERLPRATPGGQITVGLRTSAGDGNYAWVSLFIREDEIRASLGEHAYDSGTGGDTESEMVFWTGLDCERCEGSLERLVEGIEHLGAETYIYVDVDFDEIDDWD